MEPLAGVANCLGKLVFVTSAHLGGRRDGSEVLGLIAHPEDLCIVHWGYFARLYLAATSRSELGDTVLPTRLGKGLPAWSQLKKRRCAVGDCQTIRTTGRVTRYANVWQR